jgi:hypothetical protein
VRLGALRSRIAAVIAIAMSLAAALAALRFLERGEREPHAFRVAIDRGWSEPTRLVWLDGAEPLSLGVPSNLYEISPDGRTAVFGSQVDDRLRYVDLVSRRLSVSPRTTSFPHPGSCATDPHLWAHPDRVIATGWCGDAHRTGASTLAVVDEGGDVAIRTIGHGPIVKAAGGAVMLVAPPPGPFTHGTHSREERLGPATLLRIDGDGSVAQAVLRIRSGMRDARTYMRFPGLAARGHRAVVVSEDEGSAEVDLRTMQVRYHDVSFPPPPRRLLPPPVEHQGTANPARILAREAHWVDARRIAVTGYDVWTENHRNQCGEGGPWILDSRTWTARRVPRTSKLVAKHRAYTTRCLG